MRQRTWLLGGGPRQLTTLGTLETNSHLPNEIAGLMPRHPLALTGPQAAAIYQLDGFRDHDWPLLWCAARKRHHEPGVIRTEMFGTPEVRDGLLLAPVPVVLRHLGTDPTVLQLANSMTPKIGSSSPLNMLCDWGSSTSWNYSWGEETTAATPYFVWWPSPAEGNHRPRAIGVTPGRRAHRRD